MTDDIFDYFSGNSARKVEPIEDDNDQPESPVEAEPSDEAVQDDMGVGLGESEAIGAEDASDGDSSLASDEVEETVSHWDRLLGKLGISPSAKTTAPPKSIELPTLSADEKAARAAKRIEMEQARAQQDQPFGGIAAPPGSKPRPEPTESPDVEKPAAEPVASAPTEPKMSPAKEDKPAAASHKFGMGILDDISDEVPDDVAKHGNETLADMFVANEQFQAPFEEPKSEFDDFEDAPTMIDIPITDRIHPESEQPSDLDSDDVSEVAEFIEYEVQDLDFAESSDERPRRPSRRDRARRSRAKPEAGDPEARERGGRQDQTREGSDETQTRSRRGRKSRSRDDGDRDSQRDKVAADSTEARGRRGSRGRGRGRDSRDSRPPRDARDRVETDEVELDESLEIVDREEFADQDEGPDRSRGRKSRGGSRRTRQANRAQNEVDIDRDPRDGYEEQAPEPTRARRRRRGPEAKEPATDKVSKRPKIPTWSDAVASMIETNIKTRGAKSSGSGRSRGSRRSRRR